MVKRWFLISLFCLLFAAGRAPGQTARRKVVEGPANITLGANDGKLSLPKGFLYIDKAEAERLLAKNGEPVHEGILGMVAERDAGVDWVGMIRYSPIGYVKDDEADKLDADSLLESIKDNTSKDNEQRVQNGNKPIEIIGWYKAPGYNRQNHTLSWSILFHDQGETSQTINVKLMVLGRYGIMSDTVVGDSKDAAVLQTKLDELASHIQFSPGRDYASWRPGDGVSKVTMTGLITGGLAAAAYGAAKVGLLAKLGKLLLVGVLALKKMFIVVLAAIAGVWRKLRAKLTGKSAEAQTDQA